MALFSIHQLFFLFFFLLPAIAILNSDLVPIQIYSDLVPIQICEKNFTQNTKLQSNINNLLLDMVAKSSIDTYAISSYASNNSETVYGVTQCQGDLSSKECSTCITNAAQTIRTACPDSAESRIWYEKCYLHYDTDNFTGKVDKSDGQLWYNVYSAENPRVFKQAVGDLMAELLHTTASLRRKFGYGENYVNEKLTVYGMAQCTLDLDYSACNECLKYELEEMSHRCKDHIGCRIFGSSCVIRYETYKFLPNSMVEAAAPAPSIVINY